MTKEEDEEKCHNTEIKEATEAGKNEGKKEEKIEIAKDMLLAHDTLELIQRITKLSKEEILKLKNNM